MKKSLVAASIIVVLGAAWTGASWYTGKLIEQRMGEMVEIANSELKSYLPNAGIKLSFENYQRGLFSSQARYVLRADDSVPTDNAQLKPGEEIAFLETISHGPFPVAQLKKLYLLPSLASVHSKLENTPRLKTLFEITKGQSLFSAETRIAFSGDTATTIDVIPVEFRGDKNSLRFSGAKINADVGRDMKTTVLDVTNDSTIISAPNQFGQIGQIRLQGLMLTGNTHQNQFNLSLGEQAVNLKQLNVSIDGKETLSMEGIKLATQFDEQDSKLDGQINYALDAIKIQGNNFGSGKLLLKINNLDDKGVKEFSERYNQQTMALLQHGEMLSPEDYQQQSAALLLKNLPLLLKGNPSLSIAPLSWQNSKGESSFTLSIDFLDPAQASTTAETSEQPLVRFVKKIDANLKIPVSMAAEAMAQTAKLQGHSEADAQKMAQMQLQQLATLGQALQLITLKDDIISNSFHYADNQIELNGKKMSLPAFTGLFGIAGDEGDDYLQSEQPDEVTPPENSGETPKSEQPDEAPQVEQPGETPKSEQPDQAPQAEQPAEAPKSEQPDQAPQAEQPAEAPKSEQPDQAPQAEQPAEAPKSEQPDQAPQVEQPAEAPKSEQPDQAPQVEQPAEAPKSEQPDEAAAH
ncbi:DUF945 family protein [Serratia sp. UGAL515B_01]|nr:DUF945 family protein [Serratia sp. UGAL515B_01]WON78600.1 DUF945 family protein [Serratia sp. UGAL515B_01]